MTVVKWSEVQAWAETRIAASRRVIERADTPHEETMYHRGVIAACREVLSLADAPDAPITLPGFE